MKSLNKQKTTKIKEIKHFHHILCIKFSTVVKILLADNDSTESSCFFKLTVAVVIGSVEFSLKILKFCNLADYQIY